MFSLILDNALKYSASKIELSINKTKDKICIRLYNDCYSFDVEEEDKIIEKFYRGKQNIDSNGKDFEIIIML